MTSRTRFSWCCALSPFALLYPLAAASLRFGRPADQETLLAWIIVFNLVALIHLLVTLIQHRALGVRGRDVGMQALLYVAGWMAFAFGVVHLPAGVTLFD